jgi:hypothetical protein
MREKYDDQTNMWQDTGGDRVGAVLPRRVAEL